MSFAKLSSCQVDEVFACLGPDYHRLRGTCLFARDRCNSNDLSLEILKWHCVNSPLLGDKLHCLEVMGRIPVRCSLCSKRSKNRQIYRYSRARMSDGHRQGVKYIFAACVSSRKPAYSSAGKIAPLPRAATGGRESRLNYSLRYSAACMRHAVGSLRSVSRRCDQLSDSERPGG